MTTQILCRGCRNQWYEKYLGVCPACGTRRHAFNPALESQKWQTALNEKAARALREG
jgi:ribosomal protein L37E